MADGAVSGAGIGASSAGVSGIGAGAAAGTTAIPAGSAGTATTAGSGGEAGGPPPVCTIPDDLALVDDDADGGVAPDCQNIPRTIIGNSCISGICHHTPNKFQGPAARLDLMTPCVADRLLNKPSSCQGLLLINRADVDQSFLLNKLQAETPICGEPMPLGSHLPPEQQRCMNAWVHAVVRAAKP
jgi:hypothetical protein